MIRKGSHPQSGLIYTNQSDKGNTMAILSALTELFAIDNVSLPLAVHVVNVDASILLEQRIKLTSVERRSLSAGEVRVGMLAMTINPADLLQIDGRYGVRPKLPYVPGHEGVGIVLETAADVLGLAPGELVLPVGPGGRWSDELVVSHRHLEIIDSDADVFQSAMLKANPPTAWLLLKHMVCLPVDACVIQNAANSAVGQCIRQLAAQSGIRVINIVRRADAVDPSSIGDEHWIVDDGLDAISLAAAVKSCAGDRPRVLAIDAIGGQATGKLAACLDDGGTVVIYGLMSGEPAAVDLHELVFRDIRVRGFWLARWFSNPIQMKQVKDAYAELVLLMKARALHIDVEASYPLTAVHEALAHAARPARAGKVLLTGTWLHRLGLATSYKP